MVKISAASDADTLAHTKFTAHRMARFFPVYTRDMAPYSLGDSHTSPSVAAKLSCRLMLPAAKGFPNKITSSAAPRLVSPSLSRLNSGAASTNACITHARTTDGDRPTISI